MHLVQPTYLYVTLPHLFKVSGILVFVMGLMMAQRGWGYLHMAPGAAMPAQMMHGH